MKIIVQKLTSRKLWMAVAGVATGIAMALGADSTEITSVAGAVVSVISCVVYIVMEGKVDAERVKNAIEGAQEAVDAIQGGDGK